MDGGECRVFVTSETYLGNLCGFETADTICQALADKELLGGTWRAWLSTADSPAVQRMYGANAPYKLLNGKLIAENYVDIKDSNMVLEAEINVTESGEELSSGTDKVWTGSSNDSMVTAYNCLNWTESSHQYTGYAGIYSSPFSIGPDASNITCNTEARLYCIEQAIPLVCEDLLPETVCLDKIDNDLDELTDCADPDCSCPVVGADTICDGFTLAEITNDNKPVVYLGGESSVTEATICRVSGPHADFPGSDITAECWGLFRDPANSSTFVGTINDDDPLRGSITNVRLPGSNSFVESSGPFRVRDARNAVNSRFVVDASNSFSSYGDDARFFGFHYCDQEFTERACSDGIDNDRDSGADCFDADCNCTPPPMMPETEPEPLIGRCDTVPFELFATGSHTFEFEGDNGNSERLPARCTLSGPHPSYSDSGATATCTGTFRENHSETVYIIGTDRRVTHVKLPGSDNFTSLSGVYSLIYLRNSGGGHPGTQRFELYHFDNINVSVKGNLLPLESGEFFGHHHCDYNMMEGLCFDGADNDSDGNTDCADSDCTVQPQCESDSETFCEDGIDNDGDGHIDCADSDCVGKTVSISPWDTSTCEATERICNDGFDNDRNGLQDCFDPNCGCK